MGEPAGIALSADIVRSLAADLPAVAGRTVAAVTEEVAEYRNAFRGEMGATIEGAVQMALGGFLRLAGQALDAESTSPLGPAREGAYALGRGEARSGRTMDALLSAYRVGARVAWREMSATAVRNGLAASTIAQFAELVFAYIDQLSAASVAGHSDELATSGRVREQYRERLGLALLTHAPADSLVASALRADWPPPQTLTAVLVPAARVRDTAVVVAPATLQVPGDLVGLAGPAPMTVLLVPDAKRPALLRALRGRPAVVGPERSWTEVGTSYERAARTAGLISVEDVVDTEEHLPLLVLTADAAALTDLRARALAPLAAVRDSSAERLAETLRSWLLHQGRREEVAADLHVHAQTVRYRMTQLRELYGDRLTDPEAVLELTLALAVPSPD